MIKNIILAILLSLTCIGCINCKDSSNSNLEAAANLSYNSSSFNSETYVWESFLFPTNRTER